ncbi:cytoplasmic dynein 1 light intermediate chain 2 isoform X1 [Thrips palmi]|uniref:Dynein light intermediate chain n=1 Tax=Thrips palmi TaxID=161013 RepID=A0A6P9A3B8_THRPL|nr:cytoplasmic dynein 1 light intermediate chain 2 isoform X1 [Thrips palmi]
MAHLAGDPMEMNGISGKKKDDLESKENLWSAILSEVQNTGNSKLPSNKSVLVLGDSESGKTTLIAKLQGVEDPKKGSGLEYAYIDVRDEYRDDHTRLGVWVLDGDPAHGHLLRYALSEESFPHTLVMLVVAMTTPWGVLDQLQSWATILQDHIDKLKFSSEELHDFKQSITKKWLDYVEPGDEMDSSAALRRTSRNMDEELGEMPLGEGILTRNLGLDVVVVVTKTDYMSTLEKDLDYRDEHLDFIQLWIRRFCLQYGAGLFYTSVKEDKNCDLLYKYLTHRIYEFPFRTPALVVEKDAVLIPSGWDNKKKISILYENMQSMKPDDYYRDVITQPGARKPVTREVETQAEDEQAFLARQQQSLQAGVPAGVRQESPMRAPPSVTKAVDRRSVGAPGVQTQLGSPKKLDGTKPGAAGGEGVLANFFNSLLYKKTGNNNPTSPARPGEQSNNIPPVDKAVVRSDAAAELDRLTRNKKQPSLEQEPNSSEC